MSGLGAHYELVVSCRGEIDPVQGYLINIKEIDAAVRGHAVPRIHAALGAGDAGSTLREVVRGLPLKGLDSVRWKLSPYYSLEVKTDAPTTVLLRQKFDFCAAHRLHAPSLSAEENRRLYGKCNYPSGHGHNYQFEPCIEVMEPSAMPLSELERIADEVVVQRFDHKNLNTDTAEFLDGSGLNPSVENIARVCFELLGPALARPGARLVSVTVWESDRTSCTYPG